MLLSAQDTTSDPNVYAHATKVRKMDVCLFSELGLGMCNLTFRPKRTMWLRYDKKVNTEVVQTPHYTSLSTPSTSESPRIGNSTL
jgi:hypothetical protein